MSMLVWIASTDVSSSWDQLVMLNRGFLVAKGDSIQSCVCVVGDVESLVELLDSFKGVGLGSMDGFAAVVTVGISAMVGADMMVVLLLGCTLDLGVAIVVVWSCSRWLNSASCSLVWVAWSLSWEASSCSLLISACNFALCSSSSRVVISLESLGVVIGACVGRLALVLGNVVVGL